MFDIDKWSGEFCRRLQNEFKGRLRFVGLQGSYKRGEATDSSDIDMVVILDEVSPRDLQCYRKLIAQMPYSHKACGFISGVEILKNWPRFDVFQLYCDTKAFIGTLSDFIAPFDTDEIRQAVVAGASAIYHAAAHSLVFDPVPEEAAKPLCKSAFFVIRCERFLQTGAYPETKAEAFLSADERERRFLSFDEKTPEILEDLMEWSGELLLRYGQKAKKDVPASTDSQLRGNSL